VVRPFTVIFPRVPQWLSTGIITTLPRRISLRVGSHAAAQPLRINRRYCRCRSLARLSAFLSRLSGCLPPHATREWSSRNTRRAEFTVLRSRGRAGSGNISSLTQGSNEINGRADFMIAGISLPASRPLNSFPISWVGVYFAFARLAHIRRPWLAAYAPRNPSIILSSRPGGGREKERLFLIRGGVMWALRAANFQTIESACRADCLLISHRRIPWNATCAPSILHEDLWSRLVIQWAWKSGKGGKPFIIGELRRRWIIING